ncbi:hypothetical protein AG4045_002499, partial [Apium graveolens]
MKQEGISPDITTWNSLIQWHCKHGELSIALELLAKMQQQGLYPDVKIFVTIISRLGSRYGRFQDAEESINALKSEGVQLSANLFCVLANAYAQQ